MSELHSSSLLEAQHQFRTLLKPTKESYRTFGTYFLLQLRRKEMKTFEKVPNWSIFNLLLQMQ